MGSALFPFAAHTDIHAQIPLRQGSTMKRLWTQTLAWIAAVIAAILLALANPDGLGFSDGAGDAYGSHGAIAPR
jgi:hypothetical protein